MVDRCHCKRCGHDWQPRIETKPVQCPRCKSPFWDTERKRSLLDLSIDTVSMVDPGTLLDEDTVITDVDTDEGKISGVPPSADTAGVDAATTPDVPDPVSVSVIHSDGRIRIDDYRVSDSKKSIPSSDQKNSEKNSEPEIVSSPDDIPKGYWPCPHCNALNETENKTGVCSSCGKDI